MYLSLCALLAAAMAFALFVVVIALLSRRSRQARHDHIREDLATLGLRTSQAAVPGADLCVAGELNGRDTAVVYAGNYSRSTQLTDPLVWVAMRLDLLHDTRFGAVLSVVPPKRKFRIYSVKPTEGPEAIESLLTPEVLDTASGLANLQLEPNALAANGTHLDLILRDGWGDNWPGAVLKATVTGEPNADAIRNTLDHLAKVAAALEVTSQKTP